MLSVHTLILFIVLIVTYNNGIKPTNDRMHIIQNYVNWIGCFVGKTKMLIVKIDHLASKISLKVHLMKEYNEYRRYFFDCIQSKVMSLR